MNNNNSSRMMGIGDLLYPTPSFNVLSDFGAQEPFLLDGDSLILYLFSSFNLSSNENNNKQLLSAEKCQSISFFHIFETFISNLLNRKTKFNILFIKENESFYKNNTLKLIRKLCIDYYINSKEQQQQERNVQFTLISSKWWNDFSSVRSYFLENMFSFMFVLFPVESVFDELYSSEIQDLFILKTLEFFDYIAEFNSVSFEGSSIESIIYSKSRKFSLSYHGSDDAINGINQLYDIESTKFQSDKLSKLSIISPSSTSSSSSTTTTDENIKIQLFKSTILDNSKYQEKYGMENRIYLIYLVLLENLSIRDRGFILPTEYKLNEKIVDYLNQVSYETLIQIDGETATTPIVPTLILDWIDFKLFYQILIQIQFNLPKNEKELNQLIGKEIIDKCETVWNGSGNGGNGKFKDFKLFSNYKDTNNKLNNIIKEMKNKTIKFNQHDNKVYSIENDFIDSVAPQANEYLKEFKSYDYPSSNETVHTRFIDNFHYHSNRTIEPDAFTVKLKEYQFKSKKHSQRASDKSADSFKKYADSLNDPRDILIINKLNPTKEEMEKENLKKEKENLKKTFKSNQTTSTGNSIVKPKNERDKILEAKLIQDKKRYESELVECKSTVKLIKFLNNFELLDQLPELYIKYFDHLITLFQDQKSKLIKDQKKRVQLEKGKESSLSDQEIKSIENSFDLNVNDKSVYYQLVQKYLRLFINDKSRTTLTDKIIVELSKCLYQISNSLIGINDLSNFINQQFKLNFKKLDESTIGSNNSIEFQLKHSAETLVRNTGSKEDSRVRHFNPDAWQIELLDIVDRRESALICAGTSSGKTFISFYCFEQILKESNDGVVVFVCPTKALVNQLYAEVIGRYQKNYQAINHRPSSHKMVGVMTRDMRIDMENCQILITVPQCLEILFLSVVNVPFIQRVKYVIFDEVHQVASSIDGAVYERLLLINPISFIALSATIGNLVEFHEFLKKIDPARKVSLINYQSRFNDLKNYFISYQSGGKNRSNYQEDEDEEDEDDEEQVIAGDELLIDGDEIINNEPKKPKSKLKVKPLPLEIKIQSLHPLSTLDQKKTGLSDISNDLKLIAHETIQMYYALKEQFGYEQVKQFDPQLYFGDIPNKQFNLEKQHVQKYQDELKLFYSSLPTMQVKKSIVSKLTSNDYQNEKLLFDWESNITDIVLHLQKENLLPVIFFNFNRTVCSKLVQKVHQEIVYRNTNPKVMIEKKQLNLAIERYEKSLGKALADLEPGDPDLIELERLKQKLASIDYLKPQFGNILSTDIENKIKDDPLAPALMNGVGAHHSGLDKSYAKQVEYLFRCKKIQVLFATGSLAVGINMPARTVVFLGDSPYLNVLSFRQCSGRAGRRGMDNYGNVIFLGLPKQKINRLVNSNLSSIIGNSVVSPSLCLILASRYDYSINGPTNRKLPTSSSTPLQTIEKAKVEEKKNVTPVVKVEEKEKEQEVLDNWDDDDDDKQEIVLVEEKKNEIINEKELKEKELKEKQSKLTKEDIIDIQILKKSTKSLLNNSFFLGNPLQVQFQFLFSIDYLFREGYLTKGGVPIENFSGIINHLSYLEPFNFTFVSLLKGGVFDNLPSNQKDCDIYIIHILSYLFCVQNIPSVYVRSPSILVLPPLPKKVEKIVKQHNERLLKTFSTYLYIYGKYLNNANEFLPLSYSTQSTPQSSPLASTWNSNYQQLKPLSGGYQTNDLLSGVFKVTNLKKLKTTLGSNTYFSTRILPFCQINSLVNSYLLDFHKHSQKKPLINDNKIRESDIWTLLKDFSLILKVISTALIRRNPDSPISIAFSGVAKRFLEKFAANFNY